MSRWNARCVGHHLFGNHGLDRHLLSLFGTLWDMVEHMASHMFHSAGLPQVPPEFAPPEVAPATTPRPAETPGRPVRPIEVPDPEKDPMRDPDRRRELETQPIERPETPDRE
jgi:hypothetical protein